MIRFYRVTGSSMEPSYSDGDYLLVSRLRSPRKGDVVVLQQAGRQILKRVQKIKGRKYYVRGDNKKQSTDSRAFGWISKEEIFGKVIFRIKKTS